MDIKDVYIKYHLKMLCHRIRTKRMAKGWTQEQLAKESNINPTYINRIESGKRIPTLPTLIKIAYALGTHPFKLLKERRNLWIAKSNDAEHLKS